MPPLRLLGLALLAIVSMSAVPVLIKSTSANEVTIGIARLGVAVSVVSLLVFWRSGFTGISGAQWRRLGLIGAVFAVHWLSYFASIKLATAAVAATAIATYGVQYLVLAWWFNEERIAPWEWTAMVVCLIGCVVMVPAFTLRDNVTLGIAIGVFSGLLYACLPLLHQRVRELDTLQRTWGQFAFALCCFLPLWPLADWRLTQTDWWQLLTLGLLCTVVAHGLWVKASTELPAVFTGVIYYVYVPLAMASSAFFLDEAITRQKLTGAALILGASTFVTVYRWRATVGQQARGK